MFLERDGHPDGKPVAHEREEVGEDGGEGVAAGECAGGVDDDAEGVPGPAGDAGGGAGEELEPEGGAVSWGDKVGDEAEGDDDGDDAAKGTEGRVEGTDEERALGDGVGGGVVGVGGEAAGETNAGDEGETEGGAEAEEGEDEERSGRRGRWVVDKVVGCDAGVGDGGGKAE